MSLRDDPVAKFFAPEQAPRSGPTCDRTVSLAWGLAPRGVR